MAYLGAVEAGGTKFVCGIGTKEGEIVDRISFPTTTPEETMGQVIDYFRGKDVAAIGFGSFGPIDPNPSSSTYGYVTNTPKPHWGFYNVLGKMKEHFSVPIAFDTDVNVAALGESTWGAAREERGCLYITVGTGIGAGFVSNGRIANGFSHPEMGHILVRRHPEDGYAGKCPFHGDCLEGMAAGPAVEGRWGRQGHELPPEHQAWEFESYYLAQSLMTFVLTLMPEKIVIGGGVSKQEHLFPRIRSELKNMLNGYIVHPRLEDLSTYVVRPGLGDNAGLAGSIALASQAAESQA